MEETDFITVGSLKQEQNGQILIFDTFSKCFVSKKMGISMFSYNIKR